MKRTSVIGPVILIAAGLLFLWSNLSAGFEVLDLLAQQWPWILVGWGLIRLGELLSWSRRPEPMPSVGLSGGEWFLAIIICLAGSGLYGSRAVVGDFGNLPFRTQGLRVFGESYDFSITDQAVPTGKTARLLVENLRGEVIVTAEDIEDIRVSGRESLRALSDTDAKEAWESRQVTVERQGDLVVVRTNQEGMPGDRRARAYLQIRVPLNCTLETRGRDLRVEASGLKGNVDLQADDGDARVSSVQGGVTVRLAKSSEIRLRDVEGQVEINSARGDNLSLEGVRGAVVVNGTFGGNIELRKLAGPVRIEDRRLDLRAVAIPGEVIANRGKVTGRGVTGPLRIASESKDVDLEQFTEKLELTLDRSDANVRQQGPKVSPMDINIRRGKVTLSLPPNVPLRLDGRVRRGEIANRSGREFTEERDGENSRIYGGPASAPLLTVNAGRLELESSGPAPK